jgi:hypothetical protein
MTRFALALGALVLMSGAAMAQKPVDLRPVKDFRSVTTEISPTPEMWFYEQYMQQYQDPQAAVRKKAEYRSEMRERRLAAMKWFGFSNSRPRVGTDPFNGDYAPAWTSNNRWYPNQWSGVGPNYVIGPPAGSTNP